MICPCALDMPLRSKIELIIIKFTKNRRGYKYEKLFFDLENSTGSVNYDIKRLERDEEIKQRIAKEKDRKTRKWIKIRKMAENNQVW